MIATAGFAAELAAVGIKPRHCAVLELARGQALSQLDIAHRVGVTPSVVVDMLDELEDLGAVRRVADPGDRRRRVVELTTKGRSLHRHAVRAAAKADRGLLSGLDDRAQAAVRASMARLGAAHGLDFS
ncbi:MarR family winged helix-turn-helix transcriptional regulator [Fodinicola feengrottensis]|uniref:MarR family winged helix-turn-helix transcriptional regulator n=1 Tax=Fodinicola feengrottensis TaxID=435914 RepID=UPI0013D52573|nr:MarR family transcriptional regulator [Fodinicola feengrottensis]